MIRGLILSLLILMAAMVVPSFAALAGSDEAHHCDPGTNPERESINIVDEHLQSYVGITYYLRDKFGYLRFCVNDEFHQSACPIITPGGSK